MSWALFHLEVQTRQTFRQFKTVAIPQGGEGQGTQFGSTKDARHISNVLGKLTK
jgi:hypothetical protein